MKLSFLPLGDFKGHKLQDIFRYDGGGCLCDACLSYCPDMGTHQLKTKDRPQEKSQHIFSEGVPQVSLPLPTSAEIAQLVRNYAQLVV